MRPITLLGRSRNHKHAWVSLTIHVPPCVQASATLSDGRVFTIGGSWSGGIGGQNGTPLKTGEVEFVARSFRPATLPHRTA